MRPIYSIGLVVVGLVACFLSNTASAQGIDDLQGSWEVMTAFGPDTNGTVIQYPKESFPNWVFTFSKNSMMQWEGSPPGVRDAVDPTDHKRRTLAKYSVNKSRTPHQIDVTYENGLYREKTAHGIYRIMNESGEDVLTIRLPTDPTKGIHPTAFGVVGKEGCLTIRMRKRTAVSD